MTIHPGQARDRVIGLDDEELALWRADAERVAIVDPEVAAVWLEEIDHEFAIRRRARYHRAPLPTRGGIPRERIDEIKRRIDLPALLEQYHQHLAPVRRAGDHWVGLCPFHLERTPSFHVWRDHAKCFGCGIYVDAIAVVDYFDGVGFLAAVDALAVIAGMAPPSEALARQQRGGRGTGRPSPPSPSPDGAKLGRGVAPRAGVRARTRIVDGKVVSQ